MKRQPPYNAATLLELHRRQTTKKAFRSGSPVFKFNSIDIIQLYILYPELFPNDINEMFKDASEKDLKEYIVPDFELAITSAIVINHPSIEDFNSCYEDLAKVEQLNIIITNDFRIAFEQAVYINLTTTRKLKPHIDTLLYTCLFLYNKYWDPYKTDFNGPIAKYTMNELTLNGQPFHYREINQVQFLSSVLYDYYDKPNASKSITFVTGNIPHTTEDVDWIIDLLNSASFPLSMGYTGTVLRKLLNHREEMNAENFLTELKKFTNLQPHRYTDEKRRVIKDYCMQIHKVFSHYLGLSEKNLTGKRPKIYHNVLKAFNMDNFDKLKRAARTDAIDRIDSGDNRLAALLRTVLNS